MTKVDITNGARVSCAGATLDFESAGTITLSTTGFADDSVVSKDLALESSVVYWCGDEYGYFVGMKGTSLWYVKPSRGRVVKAGELDRLDLQDAYDPGGLHRVTFLELETGDLLLVHELGLARLAPSGEVAWQRTHDRLTAHLEQVDTAAVWFQDEDGRFGFDLAAGDPLIAET